MGISARLRDTPTIDPTAPALHFGDTWRSWSYYSAVTARLMKC